MCSATPWWLTVVESFLKHLHEPSLPIIFVFVARSRNLSMTFLTRGASPAGLGAAVYAASEGLSSLVLDGLGPGDKRGQLP
jgi:hypothetical protein